jgi:acetyl esterase/lipase
MGESAGGNLSAAICLLARDRGRPALSHQALLYPATNMSVHPTAASANALFIPQPEMLAYRRHYLGGADGRRTLAAAFHLPDRSSPSFVSQPLL